MSDFYKYFKENMESLGLPAPVSLFGTLQAAVTNTLIFMNQIDKYGTKITVRELVVAGTRLEKMGVAAALAASFYVGAVIGSIAVATGRSLAGGVSISDVLMTANQHDLNRPWLAAILNNSPTIYSKAANSTARR